MHKDKSIYVHIRYECTHAYACIYTNTHMYECTHYMIVITLYVCTHTINVHKL
jgi:hypothetical protein